LERRLPIPQLTSRDATPVIIAQVEIGNTSTYLNLNHHALSWRSRRVQKYGSFSSICSLFQFTISLDLIRHGKHHREDPPDVSASRRQNQQQYQQPQQPQQQQPQPQQHQQAQQAQHSHKQANPEPQVTAAPRDVAEQIVKEEREAQEKMPTYKGLENFRLLEKMGE